MICQTDVVCGPREQFPPDGLMPIAMIFEHSYTHGIIEVETFYGDELSDDVDFEATAEQVRYAEGIACFGPRYVPPVVDPQTEFDW